MNSENIQSRLRSLREKAGKTQDQVAEACGISKVALARYETGTRKPVIENASRLAQYYEVSVDYILGISENIAIPKDGGDEPEQELTAAVEQLAPDARATMKELLKFMQGLTDEKQTEVSNYALTSAKVMAEMNKK